MYDRDYAGKTLNFEASGGLANSALIMQDKQTNTYWSIMTGRAETGELAGNRLVELPVGQKMQWRDWVAAHPETLVLSVGGREDPGINPYANYYADSRGFRGATASDDRLKTKDPVFAFLDGKKPYAINARSVRGGKRFKLRDGAQIFLYRAKNDKLFRSTAAYRSPEGFEKRDGVWTESGSGARFSKEKREFEGGAVKRLHGFDTFWYTWSLAHPKTVLLR